MPQCESLTSDYVLIVVATGTKSIKMSRQGVTIKVGQTGTLADARLVLIPDSFDILLLSYLLSKL